MVYPKTFPIVEITWLDAAYTYNKQVPSFEPLPQKTVGFLITKNSKFINIAVNVLKGSKEILAQDGFIIPLATVVKIKKLTYAQK